MTLSRIISGAVTVIFALSAPALACSPDISVNFKESAPKDIFEVNNASTDFTVTSLIFDLSAADGRLIFDTDEGGPGLQVAQPFEQGKSSAKLAASPLVSDGDSVMRLRFAEFGPGDAFTFTIDVDDQLTGGDMGQTRVSGGEMKGAKITATLRTAAGEIRSADGVFDSSNRAKLSRDVCI